MATNIQRGQVLEEKELIISRWLEWGSLATQLGVITRRTLDDLTRVDSITSEMSQVAMKLATHLHQHPGGQSESIRMLIEDLLCTFRERDRFPDSPTISSGPEHGWGTPEARCLRDLLIPKAISFFQIGFSGVVQQLSARGYPTNGHIWVSLTVSWP